MDIQFRIEGEALPQPRQRHRIAKTKAGKLFVQNYVPRSCPAAQYKEHCTSTARLAHAGEPLTGPLRLELDISERRVRRATPGGVADGRPRRATPLV